MRQGMPSRIVVDPVDPATIYVVERPWSGGRFIEQRRSSKLYEQEKPTPKDKDRDPDDSTS
jgi:hypothetical protein